MKKLAKDGSMAEDGALPTNLYTFRGIRLRKLIFLHLESGKALGTLLF